MPKQLIIFLIGLIMIFTSNSFSQDFADMTPLPKVPLPNRMVDFPTAGTLPRASFDVRIDAFSEGGILGSIDIGLHNRFMIGISYGGEGVLGESNVNWNERPEYLVKLMLIDENVGFPAIAVGFESQGTGFYDVDFNRYRFKAPGFYAVLSKGYRTYNWVSGLHLGVNVNPLEDDKDKDDDISFFGGFDITFNNNLTFVGEYQTAFNDNIKGLEDYNNGRGNGYLNFGIKWTFSEKLELSAIFKDLLNNIRGTNSITRELRITYLEKF
jgi:hypothetical protein